jgi:hypothetical protein
MFSAETLPLAALARIACHETLPGAPQIVYFMY